VEELCLPVPVDPFKYIVVMGYMERDKELAQRIREQWADHFAKIRLAGLLLNSESRSSAAGARDDWLAEVVLRSRNLFHRNNTDGEVSLHDGRIKAFHFLMRDFLTQFGSFAMLAVACWSG